MPASSVPASSTPTRSEQLGLRFRVNGRFRPFMRRWLTAAMLMVAAVLAVLYVSNAIRINELLESITSLEHERDQVRSENERMRGELLRLMSVERVSSIAAERLGLVQPAYPPVALEPTGRRAAEGRDANGRDASGRDASGRDADARNGRRSDGGDAGARNDAKEPETRSGADDADAGR